MPPFSLRRLDRGYPALWLPVLLLLLLHAPSATAQRLIASVLPTSRSVQVGAVATTFVTVINAGPVTGVGCTIAPATQLAAAFTYQTTDPASNQPTGTPNTSVDIPAGGRQSFVLSFATAVPIDPTEFVLTFKCRNGDPAPVVSGLDTFSLSVVSGPVPDIVALSATPTGDRPEPRGLPHSSE